MNEITVRPLEQWMLDTVRFDEYDKEIRQHIAGIIQRSDARLFGAMINNRIVGIGGVWKFGYVFGEWGLWLTSEVRERPFWLVKTCLRYMDLTCMEMDIRRLIALVDISKSESRRFLECLGFGLQSNIPVSVSGIDCQVYEKAVI